MPTKTPDAKVFTLRRNFDGTLDSRYPAGDKPPAVYTTTFPTVEDPLSESGAWSKNASNAWSQMRGLGGRAVGSQGFGGNSGNAYNDSYAIKTGDWGADYSIESLVYRDAAINGANHEVEINLRAVDDADSVRLYEVLLNKDGQIQMFRWEDAFGSFSSEYAVTSGSNSVGDVPSGAVARFKCSIVGNVITVFYSNDGSPPAQVCTYNITSVAGSVYATGNPAIGQFCRPALDGSNPTHFCFESVVVTKL